MSTIFESFINLENSDEAYIFLINIQKLPGNIDGYVTSDLVDFNKKALEIIFKNKSDLKKKKITHEDLTSNLNKILNKLIDKKMRGYMGNTNERKKVLIENKTKVIEELIESYRTYYNKK